MRIGGLASGIDTENIIKELMAAERIPLDKLEQNKTKMEWQRDAFRDINMQISELERMITDMRLNSNVINPKTVTSSMPGAVTATGSAAAGNGAYNIAVTQLASNAINVGNRDANGDTIRSKEEINNWIADNHGKVTFYTYGEANEKQEAGMQARSFEIGEGDTIESVVRKINGADKNIRAFYDEASGQFVMETRRSGDYNTTGAYGGAEIGFNFESGESDFFTQLLGMEHGKEKGGEDAKFTYNNSVELTSKDNRYTLNGITFTFNDVTGVDANDNPINATLTVINDVDKAVENITDFVNKYNELVDTLNGTQNEPRHRDYPPLTEAQMEEMSERQIELWEEKAKSGLLRGESLIPGALTNMRSIWYSPVNNDGAFSLLTEIGISTTEDYMDGGKLEINENVLRSALEEDPSNVQNLLLNNQEGEERGLLNRLEDTLETTISRIEERAGKGSFTNEMYTMGRQLNDIDNRIRAFEDRMQQVEDRYWRQFGAMERAISMMNNQSAMLMDFGGGM